MRAAGTDAIVKLAKAHSLKQHCWNLLKHAETCRNLPRLSCLAELPSESNPDNSAPARGPKTRQQTLQLSRYVKRIQETRKMCKDYDGRRWLQWFRPFWPYVRTVRTDQAPPRFRPGLRPKWAWWVAARKASEKNSAHLSTASNKPPKKKTFQQKCSKIQNYLGKNPATCSNGFGKVFHSVPLYNFVIGPQGLVNES